jgi:heat shock protein HslJ
MRPQPVRRHAVLVTLVSLLAACYAPGAGSPPPSLDGRTFLSVTVTENGAPRPLVGGTRIRLAFAAGRFSASAGCNQMGGSYRVDAGRLVVADLATTDMGCDPARHDQDSWLGTLLTGRPAVRLSGNDLALQRESTIVELVDRRVADPDRPLVGSTWQVESLIDGQTVSSVPAGVAATLVFQPDGRLAIESGCNSGSATYTVEGQTLRLSSIALTKRACPGPAGDLEQAVLAVLGATPLSHTIEANALTVSAGDRGLGLRAP